MFKFLKKSKLKGSVAIVTGGSMGIGKAIATVLAKKGCKLVICARNELQLQETQKELNKYTDVLAVKADVSNVNDCKSLINQSIKRFKKINILVNNAGVILYKPLIECKTGDINYIIDVNLKGVIYCSREALPYLERESDSRIISISSDLGKYGKANLSLYSASKFGIIGFTESIAKELKNAKAYTICPGMTDTPMLRNVWGKGYSPEGKMKPEDVAEVVLRLCFPDYKIKSGSCVDIHYSNSKKSA